MPASTLRKASPTANKETTGKRSVAAKATSTVKKSNVLKVGATEDLPTPARVARINKMKDYSKTPGLKKKADDALAFLQKHGLIKKAKKTE